MAQKLRIACDAVSIFTRNVIGQEDAFGDFDIDAVKALILLIRGGHDVQIFPHTPVSAGMFENMVNGALVPKALGELGLEEDFFFAFEREKTPEDRFHLLICGGQTFPDSDDDMDDDDLGVGATFGDAVSGESGVTEPFVIVPIIDPDNPLDDDEIIEVRPGERGDEETVPADFDWCEHDYACATYDQQFTSFIQGILANPQADHAVLFEHIFGELPKPPERNPDF